MESITIGRLGSRILSIIGWLGVVHKFKLMNSQRGVKQAGIAHYCQSNRKSAIPTALTPQTMFFGSLSVVVLGRSMDE